MPRQGDDVELLGLFGGQIAYSYSPNMHDAAFTATGRDGRYLLWPVEPDDLPDAMRGALLLGVRGANVTTPHKAAAARYAEAKDARVERVGAANVLERSSRGWLAHNTDVEGFWRPIAARGLHPESALVLGTGGAARAAVVALEEQGAQVHIAGRDRAKTEVLARDLGARTASWPVKPGPYDLIVNATTVGRNAGESPIIPDAVAPHAVAYDLVYGPRRTKFLQMAAQAGCAVIGGEEMLLEQAAISWQFWFSEEPPREAMRTALLEVMQSGGNVG